jgi:predicted RNA-binding protein with EMAP domain
MKTYAEYLATQTVKTLNTVARDMGLKGYSKLRKAELVAFIDNAVADLVPVILDVETVADHDAIAALIAEIAVSMPEPEVADDDDTVSLEELKTAYRNMRATVNRMGGRGAEGIRRVRMVGRLRSLSNELRTMGVQAKFL